MTSSEDYFSQNQTLKVLLPISLSFPKIIPKCNKNKSSDELSVSIYTTSNEILLEGLCLGTI